MSTTKKINPLVDCVAKAILGDPNRKHLLLHFLNAFIKPAQDAQIVDVEILNPYSLKEFEADKLHIVDVKALDSQGNTYQIEVQTSTGLALAKRITYTWASLYKQQLKESDSYSKLTPVISIWLLKENLFKNKEKAEAEEQYHHHFQLREERGKHLLNNDLSIHVIELEKWHKPPNPSKNEDLWCYFFRDGKNIDLSNPPETLMQTALKDAIGVLKMFSENDREQHLYDARMRYLMQQKTIEEALESIEKEAELAKEQMRAAKEQMKAAKEQVKESEEQMKESKEQMKASIAREQKAVQEKQEILQKNQEIITREQKALKEVEQLKLLLESKGRMN